MIATATTTVTATTVMVTATTATTIAVIIAPFAAWHPSRTPSSRTSAGCPFHPTGGPPIPSPGGPAASAPGTCRWCPTGCCRRRRRRRCRRSKRNQHGDKHQVTEEKRGSKRFFGEAVWRGTRGNTPARTRNHKSQTHTRSGDSGTKKEQPQQMSYEQTALRSRVMPRNESGEESNGRGLACRSLTEQRQAALAVDLHRISQRYFTATRHFVSRRNANHTRACQTLRRQANATILDAHKSHGRYRGSAANHCPTRSTEKRIEGGGSYRRRLRGGAAREALLDLPPKRGGVDPVRLQTPNFRRMPAVEVPRRDEAVTESRGVSTFSRRTRATVSA